MRDYTRLVPPLSKKVMMGGHNSAIIINPILVVASFMTASGLQATSLQGFTYRLLE